jgi:hypothetical protein
MVTTQASVTAGTSTETPNGYVPIQIHSVTFALAYSVTAEIQEGDIKIGLRTIGCEELGLDSAV